MPKYECLTNEFNKTYDHWLKKYPKAMADSKYFIIGALIQAAFGWSERINLDVTVSVIQRYLEGTESALKEKE